VPVVDREEQTDCHDHECQQFENPNGRGQQKCAKPAKLRSHIDRRQEAKQRPKHFSGDELAENGATDNCRKL